MNEQLKQAKASIRAFIQAHWSDEKLCAVYAFNRDGKMLYESGCCCLLGVTLSERLHESSQGMCPFRLGKEDRHHYYIAQELPMAIVAERAYRDLGWNGTRGYYSEIRRCNRFSALLRAEMRRREHQRDLLPERLGLDVEVLVA